MAETDTLTVTEFLKAMKIGRTKFYEEVKAGRIATFTIGRRRYITREAVNAFLVDCGFPPDLMNAEWRPRDPEVEEQAAEPEGDAAEAATELADKATEAAPHVGAHAAQAIDQGSEGQATDAARARHPGHEHSSQASEGLARAAACTSTATRSRAKPVQSHAAPRAANPTATPDTNTLTKGMPPWRTPWYRRAPRQTVAAAASGR